MNRRAFRNGLRMSYVGLLTFVAILCMIAALLAVGLANSIWWLPLIFAAAIFLFLGVQYRSVLEHSYRMKGMRAFDSARFSQADASLRRALHYAQAYATDDPRRCELLRLLALTAQTLGNYDDAEDFGRQALDVCQQAWGETHPRTLDVVSQLGDVYVEIARYAQAEPLLERVVITREADKTTAPAQMAMAHYALGDLYCRLERWEEADRHGRLALAIAQEKLNPLSRAAVLVVRCWTLICVHRGRVEEAESYIQDACSGAENSLGPASLSGLTRLAEVRLHQKRFAEAEAILRRAMGMYAQFKIKEAPPAEDFHLLAVILRCEQKWDEAEQYFREALRLRQDYCAPEDLAIARVLEDYAELLELTGRAEEAHAHERWAKQIRDFHAPQRIV